MNFFPFSWHESIVEYKQIIEVFGWFKDETYGSVLIEDFTPFLYVKTSKENVMKIIRSKQLRYNKAQEILARGLYSNALEQEEIYCFISFNNTIQRAMAAKVLKTWYQVADNKASPVLQMTCNRNLNISDWFKVMASSREDCSYPKYRVHWKELYPCDKKPTFIPRPIIMSYDIETFAHDVNIFPEPKDPRDVIFQISIVFSHKGKHMRSILLTLGTPCLDELDEKIEVYTFQSEAKMLLMYVQIVKTYSPQILIGYNTFGFDNRYMIERAKHHLIFDDFSRQGYDVAKGTVFTSNWSSSAYNSQEFYFLDVKGRIHMDLMIFIQREYKLDSYKLNSVAMHFLGAKKDPLNHYHIRECYIKGMKNPTEESKALSYVGAYCVKDSLLVSQLFDKLKLWESIVYMANTCQTTIVDLFTHGQTKKIYCQVYRYCMNNQIIVENDVYKVRPDEIVEGASVLTPETGLYNNVVSFDFASLYPSIIISHNIDYGTLVRDDQKVEDEKCHIIQWQEHYGCECPEAKKAKKMKDGKTYIICKNYKVRWLKEPKGVIPTIIENLLKERKNVRARMKLLDPETEEYSLLNQQQLAFKVSANSMYGSFATKYGLLPFLIGGMCVTAIGRKSIQFVSELMKDRNGTVVYGDTDSNYVKFDNVPIENLHNHCIKVANEISAYFPKPMKLDFEGKIYEHYFLLSKKRYIYKLLNREDLTVSGVLLKRRDSPQIIKLIYKDLVYACLRGACEEELWTVFFNNMNILLSGCLSADMYAIGKSIKTIDNFDARPRSEKQIHFGSYIISKLSIDPKKRESQLKKKNARDELDYCYKCLPPHVQLALKMRSRGQTIKNGDRFSFLYIKNGNTSIEKMEDLEYFKLFYNNTYIDTPEYLRLLCEKPLTELFNVYLRKNYVSFFTNIWKVAVHKNSLIDEYKRVLLHSKIKFMETQ